MASVQTTASVATAVPVPVPVKPPLPVLEPGDHLTRAEFERRYSQRHDIKKAELIEGIVYMPSPVRIQHHAHPHLDLVTWIGNYRAATPGTGAAAEGTVRLDQDNEPQPDTTLYVLPACGGQVKISADDYLEGAPEWIGEVASSTASYDLHSKLNVYRRNQVREYLVLLPVEREVRWFELSEGRYELLPTQDGIIRSRQFPGLWLDPTALLNGDLAGVLRVLQQGLDSAEHKEFVERLQQARR